MLKRNIILSLIIVFKFILQYLLISPEYDLQRDEFLHLDQAHHLAWGFESVPPFTSWISWIILQLGNNVFWVKFFPALFGALTILVVWKTIEALNGNLFALIMGAVAVSFSVLPRINILFQPNSFDILCWTLFYYILIRYIKTGENKWFYFAAVVFSAGFLNKYNITFMLVGLIPAILLTTHRRIFLNKHLYFAMALCLLLIAPNLAWQYQNKFPVIHHMKELAETQLVNVQRSDFLKNQLLFFLNSIFILVLAFISFFLYPDFKKYRVFAWSLFFTLAIFTWLKAKDYYAIGLYPILLAFGAVYLEWLTRNRGKIIVRTLALIIPVILFSIVIKKIFPFLPPAVIAEHSKKDGKHRWEDGKEYDLPQDFADMLGWRELAEKTDSIYKTINDKEHTLVFCDNYGEAGAINFYTKQNIHAVSLNADYINWFPLDKEIRYFISVKEVKNQELVHEKKIFDTITPVGFIENKYARERGTGIYLLSAPKESVNNILKKEIEERKYY